MIKKLLLLVAIIYTLTLITASLVSLSGVPSLGSSYDDKIFHFLAYVVLAFLWVTYFKTVKKKNGRVVVFFFLILFGVVLELIQHQVNPKRTYDIYDLIANCIGVSLGTLIALLNNVIKLKTHNALFFLYLFS